MPFNRPTREQLVVSALSNLQGLLNIETVLPNSNLAALGSAMGGQTHLVHGHLDWVERQKFVTLADAENLDLHGAEYSLPRRQSATAQGVILVSGEAGTVLPALSRLRSTGRIDYLTTEDITIPASGTGSGAAEATEPGIAGNLAAGATLNLSGGTVPGLTGITVESMRDGVDQESDDSYRARILLKKQNPDEGGNAADYLNWALEVPGITRAWVLPNYVYRYQVGVMVVTDDDPGGIIPSPAKIQAVFDSLYPRRPLTSELQVFGPQLLAVDFEIQNLSPDTDAVRSAVTTSLRNWLQSVGEPSRDIPRSKIIEAIALTPGVDDHTLVSPDSIEVNPSQLPTLGTITFTNA